MNFSFNTSGILNTKVKRQKFGIGSLLLLLIVGSAFTAAGIFIYSNSQVDTSWKKVQGTVAGASQSTVGSDSSTYMAIVQYEVDGQVYKATSSSGSSSYPTLGQKQEVAYNPSNAAEAKVVDGVGSMLLMLLFPLIGVLLIIVAIVSFILSLRRSGTITNLKQTGQKFQGVLIDIQPKGGSNNNSVTYCIVVAASDPSGVVQNYVSDSLNGVAGLAMADFRNSPIPIDVYIDVTNPKNYYVDISDIPNLSAQRISELIQSAVKNQQPNPTFSEKVPVPAPSLAPSPVPGIQPQPSSTSAPVQIPPSPPDTTPDENKYNVQ